MATSDITVLTEEIGKLGLIYILLLSLPSLWTHRCNHSIIQYALESIASATNESNYWVIFKSVFSSVFHSATLSTLKILNQSHNTNCITIPKSIVTRHTMSHGCLFPCIMCCMTCEFIQHLLCYFSCIYFKWGQPSIIAHEGREKGEFPQTKELHSKSCPTVSAPKDSQWRKSLWNLCRVFGGC